MGRKKKAGAGAGPLCHLFFQRAPVVRKHGRRKTNVKLGKGYE